MQRPGPRVSGGRSTGMANNPHMTAPKTPKKAPKAPIKRAPNDRGQGRKPTPEGERRATSIRLSEDQHAKLARLGGADWVRGQIDKAKEPK